MSVVDALCLEPPKKNINDPAAKIATSKTAPTTMAATIGVFDLAATGAATGIGAAATAGLMGIALGTAGTTPVASGGGMPGVAATGVAAVFGCAVAAAENESTAGPGVPGAGAG